MKVLPWRYYKVKQDRTAYYAKYSVNWQKQIFVRGQKWFKNRTSFKGNIQNLVYN